MVCNCFSVVDNRLVIARTSFRRNDVGDYRRYFLEMQYHPITLIILLLSSTKRLSLETYGMENKKKQPDQDDEVGLFLY